MQNIIYLDYYAKFHCIGGECPLTCCGSWKINLTEQEIEIYEKLEGSFRDEVMAAIDKEKKTIKLKNSKCRLLTEDGWCRIVRECGEEYLSATCAVFPRLLKEYGIIGEAMVEVVCPVVAGYLLEPDQIGFGMEEIEDTYVENKVPDEAYFILSDIRGQLVDFFQEERKSHDLGKVYVLLKMQEYIREFYIQKKPLDKEAIQKYLETYMEPGNLKEIYAFEASLKTKTLQQTENLAAFLKQNYQREWFRLIMTKLDQKVYLEEFMGEWLNDIPLFEQHVKQYLSYFREHYAYFPENFFVFFLFRDWIPFNLEKDSFGNRMTLRIVEFAMIQILGMSVFIKKGELSKIDFEVIIAEVDRGFSRFKEDDYLAFVKNLQLKEILLLMVL